jgi:hypothetical protein
VRWGSLFVSAGELSEYLESRVRFSIHTVGASLKAYRIFEIRRGSRPCHRLRCERCGHLGADAGPNWAERAPRPLFGPGSKIRS